jgi:hypothetical protein
MHKFTALVFDEFLPASTATTTAAALNEKLGQYDKLSIMAIADNVASASGTLAVQIYQSADLRNWAAKNGSAEIPATAITQNGTTVLTGADTSSAGSFGFVQLKITLGANSAAHVKVYVTARDPSQ